MDWNIAGFANREVSGLPEVVTLGPSVHHFVIILFRTIRLQLMERWPSG